jgi:hypothetical protein
LPEFATVKLKLVATLCSLYEVVASGVTATVYVLVSGTITAVDALD